MTSVESQHAATNPVDDDDDNDDDDDDNKSICIALEHPETQR